MVSSNFISIKLYRLVQRNIKFYKCFYNIFYKFQNRIQMTSSAINLISKEILDASINVHKEMDPGLLESIYKLCLIKELQFRRLHVQSQISIPLIYKGLSAQKILK